MPQWLPALALFLPALFLLLAPPSREEQLARLRNLGKAFYENPTTQKEAVEEFRKALTLSPGSARERLNFGLALLRAGKTEEGTAELLKVQSASPSIAHTWFNLGIVYKKAGDSARAITQFQQFIKLVPDDPISHYNLGALYKTEGKNDAAITEFRRAVELDGTLAAPHFQLFNAYRTSGKAAEARQELAAFQALKKQQEGAAIPEDIEWNAWAEILDVAEDKPPASVARSVTFETKRITSAATGALVTDLLGDGHPRLLAWSAKEIGPVPGSPIPGITGVLSAAAGDFNNDGLPDLCVITSKGPVLLQNAGKGKFVPVSAALPAGTFHQAVWLDYDHDYDLDLFLIGPKSVLLRNAGAAGFQDRTADFPFVAGEGLSAATFRAVADTKGFDLAVSYAGRPGVLYRDLLQGRYKAEDIQIPAGSRSLRVVDADNDGYFDVAFTQDKAARLLRNRKGSFPSAPETLAGEAAGFVFADLSNRGVADLVAGDGPAIRGAKLPGGCQPLTAIDFDEDGIEDVVCSNAQETFAVRNKGTVGKHIGVRLAGVKNLKLSPGAEVEVKAGPRYQKRQYDGYPLAFGLGDETAVDTVRITWPNGLIQNEMRQASGKTYRYEEAQRLSGSCPIVWSWDGTHFRYITDILGVAPLGASSGDGRYFPVDHDEYIQIPGEALRERDGHLEVRMTEELSEVGYLDQIQLLAVDHPSDGSIFTNEKFKGPPFPEFRLFEVKKRMPPVSARDDAGRDVLSEVLKTDRRYPSGFRRDLSGVAELHGLDLNFGFVSQNARSLLVLHGWVDWADGSTFLGASQEGRGGLIPPYLQVRDKSGRWVTVIEDMGMPAGKPKTIVVDLTGKWLSDSREVRIMTNLCVYWDEIFLGEDTAGSAIRQTTVPLQSADLRFRGFSPNKVHPERLQPEEFTYEGASPVSLWNPTPGRYTRYGDVTALAGKVDDRMIVMGSGDEVRLLFDARGLPPLKPGEVRDYLFKVDGWAKDRDPNTAWSQTTEPLPFHSMSGYPYQSPERFPDLPGFRDLLTRPALRLIRPLRPAKAD